MQKGLDGSEWVRQLSKISSLRLLPHLRIAAELLVASIADTAHVARDNVKLIKSPQKQQSYLHNVEYIYELEMSKKKEIVHTL
jgi:hypothetical protein